jgi:carbonic anhydrase
MTTLIHGYIGSDTMPDCTDSFCWYVNSPEGTITKATLDKLKMTGVAMNNREVDQGKTPPSAKYMSTGVLYVATDAPSSEL